VADWAAVRRAARDRRAEVDGGAGLLHADDLLDRACAAAGLSRDAVPHGDSLLGGAVAVLDREYAAIWHDASLKPESTRFNTAHELAHWWLHDESARCSHDAIVDDPVADPLPYGEAYVSGYSPAQRRETEANVFAAEFLLPGPLLRARWLRGATPSEIARETGLSEAAVLGQLAEHLLSPCGVRSAECGVPAPSEPALNSQLSTLNSLDDSQRAAATLDHGPALITAGPGTGKTRTLVARVLHLLDSGAPPEQILCLTFSNRAAEEMHERLAQSAAEAARRVWIGTFHAYGLELLRRFGTRLGLPPSPRLLDPLDAVALMERRLVEFDFEEYEYLHNPLFPLSDILSAISRAKDELKSPEDYRAAAEQMRTSAGTEDEITAARKALEVARAYAVWEGMLREEGLLDFGDLIARSVELLSTCPDVRDQVRRETRHILVDEYQDINRASAVLVRLVAGDGEGLWAVGDLRQAIYRFRGASPANLTAFEQDYPAGQRLSLDVNYRSRPGIVSVFSDAACAAEGRPAEPLWQAARPADGLCVTYAEAEDPSAQVEGIARQIARLREAGRAYGDMALLCRTNSQAEAFAAALEVREIPALFLGDLLARPEVKDLLSLLSLACEGHGQGLLRAVTMPEYASSREAVRAVLREAQGSGRPALACLATSAEPGLRRLHAHLAPLAFGGGAWSFLCRYLFGAARMLRDLVEEDTVAAGQKRMAIRQLLALAREHDSRAAATAEHPQRAFLAHVRRLIATREDTRAKTPPAAEIDAVRVMTVHASKGLEFPVVFLPNLAKDLFPSRGRSGMAPPPPGLLPASADDEEEARLFFVAQSRAKDHLVLSRPLRVNGKERAASPLLELVRESLAAPEVMRERWQSEAPDMEEAGEAAEPLEEPLPEEWSASAVEQYMRCPRQFYYERVLRAPAAGDASAYRAFYRAVDSTTTGLREEPSCDPVEALDAFWEKSGLAGHPHETLYRRCAERIVRSTAPVIAGREAPEPLVAALENGRVQLRIAHVDTVDGVPTLEHHHAGRPTVDHPRRPRLALARLAARQAGHHDPAIRLRYTRSGETRDVPEKARLEAARVQKYERALAGIRAGEFAPHPSDEECSGCAWFFLCPL
jgi:superfamily I DNA/RNA helicase